LLVGHRGGLLDRAAAVHLDRGLGARGDEARTKPGLRGERGALRDVRLVLARCGVERLEPGHVDATRVGGGEPGAAPEVGPTVRREAVDAPGRTLRVGAVDEPQRPADALVDRAVDVVLVAGPRRVGGPDVLLVDVLRGAE